ncbi:hypothetical protein AB834_00840 [PVC group bacterium (ex Bugula neritina AB1)]|nr:hypothetical protein AB834_00840 [PVC group bacterium (ex Bugula neritina AB1)]
METLTFVPDFPFKEKTNFKTLKSTFESGHTQTRAKWNSPLKSWDILASNRSKTEVDDLLSFFSDRKGCFESFLWENPNDSLTYTVRFSNDSIVFSKTTANNYKVAFSLEEVK